MLSYNENFKTKGYNKLLLDQNLNSMMSIPFFLFIMTALVFYINNEYFKKSQITYILTGLVTCILIYYF